MKQSMIYCWFEYKFLEFLYDLFISRKTYLHKSGLVILTYIYTEIIPEGTIHLRRQHVLGGGEVSPWADGQKVIVHKDQ